MILYLDDKRILHYYHDVRLIKTYYTRQLFSFENTILLDCICLGLCNNAGLGSRRDLLLEWRQIMIDEYQATNYMMNLSSSYSASQTVCLLITLSYRFQSRIVSCISQSDSVPLSERDDKWPIPCCALHRALIIVQ